MTTAAWDVVILTLTFWRELIFEVVKLSSPSYGFECLTVLVLEVRLVLETMGNSLVSKLFFHSLMVIKLSLWC